MSGTASGMGARAGPPSVSVRGRAAGGPARAGRYSGSRPAARWIRRAMDTSRRNGSGPPKTSMNAAM